MATAYIALGSNLGDRYGHLLEARRRLAGVIDHVRMSPIYETDPVGYLDQPPFLNAVIGGTTTLPPLDLLQEMQGIETELGRERPFPNAPRTVDLDLLLYDDLVLETPRLTLPHPRLQQRFFVLVPLAALAPDLRHPLLDKTVRDLLRELGAASGIRPFTPRGRHN